jgi:hypothetical protein
MRRAARAMQLIVGGEGAGEAQQQRASARFGTATWPSRTGAAHRARLHAAHRLVTRSSPRPEPGVYPRDTAYSVPAMMSSATNCSSPTTQAS